MRDLDRRLGILESTMVGRGHGRGVMKLSLGWSPEVKERGFALWMGRFMATPFLLRGPPILRKLDLGVGLLYGNCTNRRVSNQC